ncbi:MAG: ABC transporter substrate-binding protein [Chloroflexi bacterium]|nr:MAG: ABC transporter substrate-binding protein [Chloroflexota bacterium]
MKHWLSLLLVAVLVAAVVPVVGCSESETIKIGALFDVTGPNSPLGTPEKQVVEMMETQINHAGGINGVPIEVIVYDTEGKEDSCVSLATRLIEQDGVVAIIGPSSTGESLAVIDTVDKAQIPMVSCAADERITIPVGDSIWVFKTPQTTYMAVQEIYSYIQDQGITKIAIMTDTKGFGAGGKKDLEDEASNYGLTIVSNQSYDNEETTNWDPFISKIENSGAEAVVCWGTNPGPALIAKALDGTGIPFFGSHGIANTKFIEVAGDAAEGVIFPVGKMLVADQLPDSDPQKAVLLQLKSDYEALYGEGTCNTFAGHAYDALKMVQMAVEEVAPDKETLTEELKDRKAFAAKIRTEIENIEGFAGTGGVFNMSPDDHCGLSKGCMVVVKIVNGEWVWLQD